MTTTRELIEVLSKDFKLNRETSKKIIETIFNKISIDIKSSTVKINNFGSFYIKDVKEKNGINPQTHEKIIISAKKRIKFKPYQNLKEIVKEK